MYVAVKGGERAIENAHRLLAHDDEIRHLIADRIVDVTSFAAAA